MSVSRAENFKRPRGVRDPNAPSRHIEPSENAPCPECGKQLPDLVDAKGVMASGLWLFNGKFYCGETCAYEASKRTGMENIPRGLPS